MDHTIQGALAVGGELNGLTVGLNETARLQLGDGLVVSLVTRAVALNDAGDTFCPLPSWW